MRTKKPMNILSFGNDANLLLPEDPLNESQFRQQRYCEILGIRKAFVILTADDLPLERTLAGGAIRSVRAYGSHRWQQVLQARSRGLELANAFRPDLVEYQDPKVSGLAAYLTARSLGLPLVGGVFNDFLDNPTWLGSSTSRRLLNRVGKFVLTRSAGARCDSVDTSAGLKQRGFSRVEHIPFFVPWLDRFAVSDLVQDARMERWDEDPTILCVARLSEEKNIPLLLQAFAAARRQTGRGRLVVVGSGALESEVKRLANQLDLQAQIQWIGNVDYLNLPGEYEGANLFVLSSDSETSARVLSLAQASRLPTISTNTAGSLDIVKDGLTGFITPVGDTAAFTQALTRLTGDRAAYRSMLYATAYSASEVHGERMIDQRLRAFYGHILSSRLEKETA